MSPLPTSLNRQAANCRRTYVGLIDDANAEWICMPVGREPWERVARSWCLRRLATSKEKDCDRQPRPCDEVQHVNWGRFAQILRECVPDDVHTDGASVVVRGRETRPHGEGRQLKWFAWLIN